MINLKNDKGITLVALTITILLFMLILSTITFSSLSSVHVKQLNNMYADITNLQEKIDIYYLQNGTLPVKAGEENKINVNGMTNENIASTYKWLAERNGNDGDIYYLLTEDSYQKLGGITLSNSKAEDKFYINELTHTIYYEKGVQVSEVEGKKYTIDLSEYTNFDLTQYQ